ncbi:MAG: hypothetical protein LBR53_10450 [Deltaproteobacteria bacterium]|jgi:hypothetical protein|nr:hypothetical protein [Deltaproteobacteria bacterium]
MRTNAAKNEIFPAPSRLAGELAASGKERFGMIVALSQAAGLTAIT